MIDDKRSAFSWLIRIHDLIWTSDWSWPVRRDASKVVWQIICTVFEDEPCQPN